MSSNANALDAVKAMIAARNKAAATPVDINAQLLQRLKPVTFKPTIPVAVTPVPKSSGFLSLIGGKKPGGTRSAPVEELPAIGEEEHEEYEPRSTKSPGVTRSAEFLRIAALPRRPWGAEHAPDLTAEFAKPGAKFKLRQVQSWALHEMRQNDGALCAVAVGAGKSLCALLAPAAMQSPRAVILVPPQVKDQMLTKDIPNYFQHFNLPLSKFQVVSYSELSNAKTADVLHRLQPELIVADECFPAETLIVTDKGLLTIGEVVDQCLASFALSCSPSGTVEWKRITGRMRKVSRALVIVRHETGSIVCTPTHRVWTTNRGYVEAHYLYDGDVLLTHGGNARKATIPSAFLDVEPSLYEGDVDVYDIEVEDNHNFFADGVLVHNCHLLRNAGAARSKRFTRYFKDYPKTRFVGLSGTITRKSIKDYAHLAELALKLKSPLPLRKHFHELMDWAAALDVGEDPLEPGALIDFCTDEEKKIISFANPRDVDDRLKSQKAIREGYRRRLVETPGIVATEEGAIGTSLIITGLYPKVPAEVEYAIKKLRATWEIADDELTDAAAVSRVARQLAAGFYYRWVWPEAKKNTEWLQARSDWNKEVRGILKRSRPGLDSPMLVAKAAKRGEIKTQYWAAWGEESVGGEVKRKNGETRPKTMRDIPAPPVETVWISDYLVQEAASWCKHVKKTAPAIVWYEHVGFGEALAKLTGLPLFGSGEEASKTIINVDAQKQPCIIASRIAHGTGKNLQNFSRCLFTTPMSGGVDWEQTLARLHRPGQEADTVEAEVFLHTAEMLGAFQSACAQAQYTETTQGQKQKLLYATKVNCEG